MNCGCDSYIQLLNNGNNTTYFYKKDNIQFLINSYILNNSLFVSIEYSDKINIEKKFIKVFANTVEKVTYQYGEVMTINNVNMKKIILSVDHNYQNKRDTIEVRIDGFDIENCFFY